MRVGVVRDDIGTGGGGGIFQLEVVQGEGRGEMRAKCGQEEERQHIALCWLIDGVECQKGKTKA